MISYTFHPEAELEFAEAAAFYESRMVNLGHTFAGEVKRTLLTIREYPESGSPIAGDMRRMVVRRFPYSLVYRYEADTVLVLAVAHHRRRPGFWRGRR